MLRRQVSQAGTWWNSLWIPRIKDKKKLLGTLTGTPVGDLSFKGEYSKGKLKFTIMVDVGNFPLEIDFQGKLLEDGTLEGTAGYRPDGNG